MISIVNTLNSLKRYIAFPVDFAYPVLKISISTDISVLGFYGYIDFDGYFYINIDISEINKNALKFMEMLCKSVRMTLIMKYSS